MPKFMFSESEEIHRRNQKHHGFMSRSADIIPDYKPNAAPPAPRKKQYYYCRCCGKKLENWQARAWGFCGECD